MICKIMILLEYQVVKSHIEILRENSRDEGDEGCVYHR